MAEQSVILVDVDSHFKAQEPRSPGAQDNHPPNMKVCQRGEWNVRMLIETVLSMLTTVCHFKKVSHRVWRDFESRLAFTMAAFNVLVDWNGVQPDDNGFVHLSIAEFSL